MSPGGSSEDVDVQAAPPEHIYLSTSCHHGQHERCRAEVVDDVDGHPFRKVGSECKICEAPCVCACHRPAG